MKDQKGLYYYPFPQNKRVRMYVRKTGENIEFRLWNQEDPELWKQHGWISYEAIQQASDLFHLEKRQGFDPNRAYDLAIARELLKR